MMSASECSTCGGFVRDTQGAHGVALRMARPRT